MAWTKRILTRQVYSLWIPTLEETDLLLQSVVIMLYMESISRQVEEIDDRSWPYNPTRWSSNYPGEGLYSIYAYILLPAIKSLVSFTLE